MDGERINLTVSGPVAQVVAELSELMGVSKSAAVASFLAWQLPGLRAQVLRLRASETPGGLTWVGADPSAKSGASAAPAPSTAVSRPGLSRAERRRQEREERKAGIR